MKQLIEGMLSIGSRLTEKHGTGRIVDRLAKTVHRFSVGFHIRLLQMCRETAQCLRIRKHCSCRITKYISLINTDQGIHHGRVFQYIFIGCQLVLLCCTFQELCKYFRSEGQ